MEPASETELSEAIRGAGGPLSVRGGGTRVTWRPERGAVLSTAGLSGVRLYQPGALTLVAGAGTPLREIESVLAEKGQRLAFEPMDARALMGTGGVSTIGGVIAANVSGPRRVMAGAARDFLLGVRFVDGAGRIVKNGGRVMKNVTGYELVKLMAGSHGTLGVLTEVALKVLAVPEAEATLVFHGHDPAAARAAMAAALRSPFEVSGAAWLDAGAAGGEGETRLRIEGMAGSVAYRAGRLAGLLGSGWARVDGAESAALWREVRDVLPFAGGTGAAWRLSLRPSAAPGLLRDLAAGPAHRAMMDWGGGRIWLEIADGPSDCGADGGVAAVRGALARAGGGHATLIRAPDAIRAAVPMFQPEPPGVARLTRALRERFDPEGRLNPGLMGPAEVPA